MKIGINLAAKILKENIVEEINASGCPITIVANILNELGADARRVLAETIQAEAAALQSAQTETIPPSVSESDTETEAEIC